MTFQDHRLPALECLERRLLLAATLHVGSTETYHTIQSAIDAAASGDTVLVDPGTYNEELKITTSGITVESVDGAGSTFLNGNSANNNFYMVEINADNVTLKGFDISNPIYSNSADASGVAIGDFTRVSGVKILDNVIHDMGSVTRPVASFGTYGINDGPSVNTEIAGNTIYNIGNADPNGDAVAILTWGNDSSTTNSGVSIHDNVIYNITHPTFASGISVGFESRDAKVMNNTITGVMLGITTSASIDLNGTVTITGNAVTGGTTGMTLNSPYLTNVTNNEISGNVDGIISNSVAANNTHVNQNNITGNSHSGLTNNGTGTLDAEHNWWGSIFGPSGIGPGFGDAVYGDVDYSNWLTGPAPGAPGSSTVPMTTLQTVLTDLIALQGTVHNKQAAATLASAINYLENALAPANWRDASHLTPLGAIVFRDDLAAEALLTQLEGSSGLPKSGLMAAINDINQVDQQLKQNALTP